MADYTLGGSTINPDTTLVSDREKLIIKIRDHIKRHNEIPETTTENYKLIK